MTECQSNTRWSSADSYVVAPSDSRQWLRSVPARVLPLVVLGLCVVVFVSCSAPSVGEDGGVGGGSANGGGATGGGATGGGVGGGANGGGASGGGATGGSGVGGGATGGGVGGGTTGGGVGGGTTGGGVGGGTTGGGSTSGGGGGATGGGGVGGGVTGGGVGSGTSGGGGGGATGGGSTGGGSATGGGSPGTRPPLDGGTSLGAIRFTLNAAGSDDYAQLTTLPPSFGAGEFTFELWIRPDNSFPIGACADGTMNQRTQWCTADPAPYSSNDWWFKGNFLLDGHNNMSFNAGTFSLQFYGGGRLRWLFGDQGNNGPGSVWGIQAHPASNGPPLLDGQWHHVACIRRWQATTQARLELWIDGLLIDSETSNVRTDMTTLWNTWSTYPPTQPGWFFGAEKQSAIGSLSQYEDYKGLLSELRFWTRALGPSELAPPAFSRAVTGSEAGLAAWFRFSEGTGTRACDALSSTRCLDTFRVQQPFWH